MGLVVEVLELLVDRYNSPVPLPSSYLAVLFLSLDGGLVPSYCLVVR